MVKYISNTIMPLYAESLALGNSDGPLFEKEGWALLSLAREASAYIAKTLAVAGKRVMVPGYTCAVVSSPFRENGWNVAQYAIDENMRINAESFLGLLECFKPDVVVAHPYSGQEFNEMELELLQKAKTQGCFILEDLTQAALSKKRYDFIDAYTGSLRKWFNVPDGAFLESNSIELPDWKNAEENTLFVEGMMQAQYIRGLYFQTDDKELLLISRHMNEVMGEGGERKRPTKAHRMSDFSRRIMSQEDLAAADHQRMKNARYLYEHLKDSPNCKMVFSDVSDITTGPLWLPVYADDPVKFRDTYLRPYKIAGVRQWLDGDYRTGIVSPSVDGLFHKLMHIPVSQHYTEEDMQVIADAINGK